MRAAPSRRRRRPMPLAWSTSQLAKTPGSSAWSRASPSCVCDLGLTEQLVGRTGFCIHPWETVRSIPKVGGTKDVKLDRIRELAPTHAIVNIDENRRETADAARRVRPAHRRHPPAGAARQPRPLSPARSDLRSRGRGRATVRRVRARLRVCRRRPRPARDVLYLIWREPWMAVAPRHLHRPDAGARQLAAPSPLAAADRYPEVDLSAFAGKVDRVLLSSEPYHFRSATSPRSPPPCPAPRYR